ncbi:MAG: thioredoxin family protein, partial [Pirellulales bacterium]
MRRMHMSATRWAARGALLALALATPAAAQEGLRWETTLESAQQLAQRTNRLVLVHFAAPWCGPCQRLEQEVFSQPGFGRELENHFVAVKLNCDHFPATARQFGIERIPADVIISPQGELLHKVPHPERPYTTQDYVATMHQAGLALRRGTIDSIARNDGDPRQQAVQPAGHNDVSPDDRYADYNRRRQAALGLDSAASPSRGSGQVAAGQDQRARGAADEKGSADDYCELPRYEDSPQGNDRASGATNMVDERYSRNQFSRGNTLTGPVRSADRQQRRPSTPPPTPQIPAGNPPLGLDGYCPVTLGEKRVWQIGDVRWGAIHRGRTYLFT